MPTFVFPLVPCPLLTAPDNGVLDCSLRRDTPFTGDSCTFTCDDDYVLSGSATRSCHIDGTWSGTQAACLRGGCTLMTLRFLSAL